LLAVKNKDILSP